MNNSDLRIKILEDVQHIPEDQLIKLYNLVHSFRLNSKSTSISSQVQTQSIMQFAGCWNDFPAETYTEWLTDISQRRHQAFSQRQDREAFLD